MQTVVSVSHMSI